MSVPMERLLDCSNGRRGNRNSAQPCPKQG
jgi:hypothetical protein